MKITNNTINVLKNFSRINPSIVVKKGNVLKTMSPSKTIFGIAEVDTIFPINFAIYNLDRFISTLSLFTDPDLEFNEKSVTISNLGRKIQYTYADESVVVQPPDKEIKLPTSDVEFTMTTDNFKDIEKASGILALPEVVVTGDGSNIFLQVADTSNPSGDIFSINIGETNKTFKAIFKFENLKLLQDNYNVTISSKKISHFKGTAAEYYVAVEANSTF